MSPYANLLEHLGWAVVHSLWQGVIVLLAVLVVRKLAGPSRPHVAYLAGITGLAVTFTAFLGTLAWLIGSDAGVAGGTIGLNIGELNGAGIAVGAQNSVSGGVSPSAASFDWAATIPFLGLFWAVGFFALSLQCMYAWAKTRCYATLGLSAPEGDWTARFAQLVERSNVATNIRLRVSALVESPVTLGTLKPIVLVPAGFLTGLPAAQVEAVLLHEIAHIRRHDFVVGLIQTAIRTTLYFNPAVLLMSRLVNEDREQACDDFAVQASGNATDLAKGLAALRLSLAPSLAMAAKSGPLVARLERLVGRPVQARGLDKVSAIAISAVLVGSTVFASSSWAHPHPEGTPAYMLDDTVVMADVVPPFPPVPPVPAMPPVPEIPPMPILGELLGGMAGAVPPMPPVPEINRDTPGFEARMEAWGEAMEEWGETFGENVEESFGENFESRMEVWGEGFETRMEAWAESIEDEGDRLEELDDMSDAELAALGLTREDVTAAGEAFGMNVAEAVVSSILPGVLAAEAQAEFAAERREIDGQALSRVERAIAVLKAKENAQSAEMLRKDARRASGEARREARKAREQGRLAALEAREARAAEHLRAEARAEASRARAEGRKTTERLRKEARELTERHAHVERHSHPHPLEAPNVHHDHESNTITLNGRSFQLDDLRGQMLDALREDGLIALSDNAFTLKRRRNTLTVNGRRLSGKMREHYMELLDHFGVDADTELSLDMDDTSASLDFRNGDSRTTFNFKD